MRHGLQLQKTTYERHDALTHLGPVCSVQPTSCSTVLCSTRGMQRAFGLGYCSASIDEVAPWGMPSEAAHRQVFLMPG